ncbi:hypothetical protein WY02_03540 [Pseudonocardia sp. AL041005-10]|nr:hypothetical protein [Pseudonocardia sp. AL041005-10]ALE77675.1 hypothetical protein WY02_03540 [Pseudonocardia sp. AL041005-10]
MSAPTSETRASFIDERGWMIVDKAIAHYLWTHVQIGGQQVYFDTDLRTRLAPHPDDLSLYADVQDDPAPDAVQWPAGAVERLPGGGINVDGYEDLARIQVTAFGLTRDQSDAMTAQIRGLMHDLSDGEYLDLEFDRIREDTGPGRVPDPVEDLRTVPSRWTVRTRQQS